MIMHPSADRTGNEGNRSPCKHAQRAVRFTLHQRQPQTLPLFVCFVCSQTRQHCMTRPTHHYEFFGPYKGPVAVIIGLPAVCFGLVAACNTTGCTSWWLTPPSLPKDWHVFEDRAIIAVLGWILFQVCLWLLLPGKQAQGVLLRDGRRLTYKLTG